MPYIGAHQTVVALSCYLNPGGVQVLQYSWHRITEPVSSLYLHLLLTGQLINPGIRSHYVRVELLIFIIGIALNALLYYSF